MIGTAAEPLVATVVPSATQVIGAPLVPGSWVTIYGQQFAAGPILAQGSTLPLSLGGIDVLLGGSPVPLYYADAGQVNAVIPWALAPNVHTQLVLRREGAPALPLSVTLTEVNPGLFTMNQQGTGQAAALLAGTAALAAAGSPAKPGGIIELYGSGFGPVNSAPVDGMPASLTQPPLVNNSVTATVGGMPARILFAGLAPGTIGLYQIDVQIPDDTSLGDTVEVVLFQKGVRSNSVTIAIH